MSDTTTATVAAPEPKKAVVRRKPAAKAKKAAPAKDKPALRFQQVRILKVLNKASKPLTRAQIGEKASVNGGMTAALGPVFLEDIKETEKNNGQPCLIGLGYVKCSSDSINDKNTPFYEISAAGRRALEALNNDPSWPAGH